jgi:integrase
MAKKKKRMRLPNGIGSVHKIGDGKSRRRPWRARVPSHLEFNADTGKATQKYIILGYYETEQDAIAALFDYRKDPYTMDAATCTFADVYAMWSEKKFAEISVSGKRGYIAAYKKSEPLHNMKMRDIRAIHMERVMASVDVGYQAQAKMKVLWGQMYQYAMEHDLVQKDYSAFVSTKDKQEGTNRTAIPAEEREKLWQAIDNGDQGAMLMMIYIYTGMRAAELLEMRKENVDLNARIMVGGKKTAAGANRRIPIHKAIMPFIEELMATDGDLLVMRYDNGYPQEIAYSYFSQTIWKPLMSRMKMDYTPHYCRHTCATMMREANIAEDIRKLILGHSTGDITDRYTHHPDSMLVEAMDMVAGR